MATNKRNTKKRPRRYYAYCWMSGLIEFGYNIPKGALPIMQGDRGKVLDRVNGNARHGYNTKLIDGRPTKIPGTECLLVPGIPEQENAELKYEALLRFKQRLNEPRRRAATKAA